MGINRISDTFLNNQAIYQMNTNTTQVSNLEEKLSSNQNINQPSDDPMGLTQLLDLSSTMSADTSYSKNISTATAEVNTSDTAISNIVNLVQQAQTLAVQAANATTTQAGRTAIGLQIKQITDQLVQLGNTNLNGQYIYGGFQTGTPPFTVDASGNITYNGTPPTQDWQRNVEIAQSVEVPININGQNLLGQAQVTTAGPPLPPTFSASSSGILMTLVNLQQDLNAAGDPNQTTEIQNRLDDLTTNLNSIEGQQAIVGSTADQLQLTQSQLATQQTTLTQQYGSIQNINMAATIANLNQAQNTFQASLTVTGRVLQTSLLSYLK